LNVRIGDDDELGTFIFRTTGFNSIRTLAARLSYFQSVSGNLLACMPLELKLRGKSTTQSHRTAIFYADITVRDGMTLEQAIAEARTTHERRQAVGFDQEGLDHAARLGFQNAAFETTEEEVPEILEEFFPEDGGQSGQTVDATQTAPTKGRPSLKEKLDSKGTAPV
jgi:ABC-type enterochelin transport system substrate-binding protein